jgi:hypothetical protein
MRLRRCFCCGRRQSEAPSEEAVYRGASTNRDRDLRRVHPHAGRHISAKAVPAGVRTTRGESSQHGPGRGLFCGG